MKTSSTNHTTEGAGAASEPFQGNFAELCHWAYEEHFQLVRDAKKHLRCIQRHVDLTWLGALDAHQVTTAELEKYLAEFAETRTERGTRPSAGTIKQLRKMFSGVFKVAIRHGIWSGKNPATKGLASHEIGPVLLAVTEGSRGVFAVGLLAGLRRGEIFALRKKDVDLARRVLLVGSTEHAIPEQLVPYLEAALDKLFDQPARALLFPDGRGNKRSGHADLATVLRRAMARAGIIAHYDHKCRRKGCRHVEQHYDGGARLCPKCNGKLSPYARARKISFDAACRAARAKAPVIRDNAFSFTSLADALKAIDTAATMIVTGMAELSPARRKALKGACSDPQYKRIIEWELAMALGRGGVDHRELLRRLTIWADESRANSAQSKSHYKKLQAAIVYRDGDLDWPSPGQRIAELAQLFAEGNVDGDLEWIETIMFEMLFNVRESRQRPPTPPRHLRAA